MTANLESYRTGLVKSKSYSFYVELEHTLFLHLYPICQLCELNFINQVENKYLHFKENITKTKDVCDLKRSNRLMDKEDKVCM